MDASVATETSGLKVTIFWPEENMPHRADRAEVVVVRKAKVVLFSILYSVIFTLLGPSIQGSYLSDRQCCF